MPRLSCAGYVRSSYVCLKVAVVSEFVSRRLWVGHLALNTAIADPKSTLPQKPSQPDIGLLFLGL